MRFTLILKSKRRKIRESINLYEPVDNKFCFADLKVIKQDYCVVITISTYFLHNYYR